MGTMFYVRGTVISTTMTHDQEYHGFPAKPHCVMSSTLLILLQYPVLLLI
jgi:hypothetical protein